MSVKVCSISVALLALPLWTYGAVAEDPGVVRRLIEAGAVEFALGRIEALQPGDRTAADWAHWEALRCDALARLKRRAVLLERVNTLAAVDAALLNTCFVQAARAAVQQNDPVLARAHAASVLWQRNSTPAEAKAARLTVIESYVAERRGDEAFRSMLRFEQDYQPLERGVAENFANALLDLGRDREALTWVGRMEGVNPARLWLQLRSGTLSPEAVITQARAALVRNQDARYWRVIHEAAVKNRNGSLQVEALERVLQQTDARDEDASSAAAQRLWQAYFEVAANTANREQLLMGDDGAWADYAARRLASDAFVARAFYGYLVRQAQNTDIQRNAQFQLAFSLSAGGLDYTALRLLQRTEPHALDAQARYLLGTIAAKRNDSRSALMLWNGLAAPANVNATEWQLTVARVALQAGEGGASVAAMQRLIGGRSALSPELTQSVHQLAQEMLELRKLDAAEAVYELLVPVAHESYARETLLGLGRTQELKGEPLAAAGSYLRAALFKSGAKPDALALQARLLAALNLLRSELKDDARAQFEWLVKNAKDPAVVETARLRLGKL